jgi:hypothetical protein
LAKAQSAVPTNMIRHDDLLASDLAAYVTGAIVMANGCYRAI